MKKLTILFMLCLLLTLISGCDNTNTDVNSKGEFLGYVTGDYYDRDYYDSNYGIYPGEFEIDEELALDIGNSVIKSLCGDNEDDILEKTEFVVYKIKEDVDKDVFVVGRWYPDRMGEGYYVAINKRDGAILKIWGEE